MANIQTGITANPAFLEPAATPLPTAAKQAAPKVSTSATTDAAKDNTKSTATPSLAELKKSVSLANKELENSSSNQIRFAIDKATGIDVVKLVDQETGKTIRQYPSKQMLEIAQSLEQAKGGALIKQEA